MSPLEATLPLTDELAPPIVPPPRMSEEEFVAWCKRETRAEWVDGEVIIMSPVAYEHTLLLNWLSRLVGDFVEHYQLGVVVGPEFQIRLAAQRRRRVPDLLFIDKSRLGLIHKNHLEGAPDLAIEVVSPESVARDWRDKFNDYQSAGVREYWVIDPVAEHVEVDALGDEQQYRRLEEKDGKIHSTVLPDFWINTIWLWRQTRPSVSEARRELGI